jgi:hypothetical protein
MDKGEVSVSAAAVVATPPPEELKQAVADCKKGVAAGNCRSGG